MAVDLNWGLLQTPDFAGGALRAYEGGRQVGQEKAVQGALSTADADHPDATIDSLMKAGALDKATAFQDYAQKRALKGALSLYSTDPDAAIAKASAVDPQAGAQLTALRQAQQKQQVHDAWSAALQSHDLAKATDLAMSSGDPDILAHMDKIHEHAAQTADLLAQVGYGLKKLPYDQRRGALEQVAPGLINQGVDPKMVAGFDPTDANIDTIVAQSMSLKDQLAAQKPVPLAAGGSLVDPLTGKVVAQLPDKPHATAVPGVTDANGNPIFYDANASPDEATRQARGGGVATSNVAPEGDYAQGHGITGGFQGVYHGFVAPHEGGYTPSDGNGAPANMGINQKANPDIDVENLTPEKAQQIYHDRYWVPSGADHLPAQLSAIQFDTAVNMGVPAAMRLLQQSGGDPQRYLQLREDRFRQIAEADPAKADRLPAWLNRNRDLAQYVGALKDTEAVGTPSPPSPSGPIDNTLTGDSYLKQLDPTMQSRVKALVEGRMAVPGGGRPNPYWQAVINNAVQYDPNFNAGDYNSRAKTRADFTSGKSAQNITSLNTVAGHMGALDRSIDEMGNLGLKLNNVAAHAIADQTGTNKRLANFRIDREAVASELTRVFRGNAGAEADIQAWKKNLDENASPAYLHKITRELAGNLLQSRMDALTEQYQQGMGRSQDGIEVINPHAKEALQRISALTGAGATTPKPPAVGAVVKGYKFKGGNPADRNSWVKTP